MRFGIVAPATPDLIAHCETAEALGFESAWLFDSHMVCAEMGMRMNSCGASPALSSHPGKLCGQAQSARAPGESCWS